MNRHLRSVPAAPAPAAATVVEPVKPAAQAERIGDVLARVEAERRARRRFFDDGTIADTRWNGWRLDAAHQQLTLTSDDGHVTYWIDLMVCDQSAAVLDWVAQVACKNWPQFDMARVVAGLVYAFDDVFGLQSHLCGWGVSQMLSGRQIRQHIFEFVSRFNEGERP
jgi:hypothetical protein